MNATDPLEAAGRAAAAAVLSGFSTSFGLATRLLPRRCRADIRALYAVVRVADEIVDSAAGLPGFDAAAELDRYERDVRGAATAPFHTDPVLQAFSATARRCRFTDAQLAAFFSAMRDDVRPRVHDRQSLARYVHGSAEVIGEMCVLAFTAGRPVGEPTLRAARRLGAAFQKVNFLRDVRADRAQLGRDYIPWVRDEATAQDFIAEIRADLAAGCAGIGLLPAGARPAVALAAVLYSELTDRLAAAGYEAIRTQRVRVPAAVKARVCARVLAAGPGRAVQPGEPGTERRRP